MSAEQRRKCATPKHGLYDAQRGGRRGKRGCRNALVVCPQLLQRADQAVRLAYHSRTGFIGGELSLPRKTELQQKCAERRQKKKQQPEDARSATALTIIAVAASKPWGPNVR